MKYGYAFTLGLLVSSTVLGGSFFIQEQFAFAQSSSAKVSSEVERLRNEINDRNNRLTQIAAEIKQYESQLKEVGAEKNTLQNAINQLELERKKVQSDLSYTQNKIGSTDLEIEKLEIEINETNQEIEQNRAAIKETIRRIAEIDAMSMIETLLRHDNLSEFWTTVDELAQVRTAMNDEVRILSDLNDVLANKRAENQEKRGELVTLTNVYADQKEVLEINKSEKNQLLAKTKSEEASYQAMLAEKKAAQEQILKDLQDFESQLKFVLDPTTIPSAGTAVFRWPVDNVQITQYFGNTAFAQSGAYNGSGHNGIDIGTPRGTKLMAPLAGTVRATGNTDAVSGCYSWGKWTLIDHANGLSTLYAHQDLISVTPDQKVATGEVIGYTGNTGYSTGPHLHFTVYVQDAVSIQTFNQVSASTGRPTSCGGATTPVAATNAYLNPMQYLPAL